MQTVINLTLGLMTLALLLCFVRLVRGPSLPDRVVALELFSVIIIGIIGVHTINTDVKPFLDVAIVVALMSFLATVGFARFLERGGQRND
ncbi:monovalent cation/H+ antiporter complex subunit F [Halomonas sp. McH1-25]|uniref:monovalent cation/H+ antiporter complex subunit F n=1 Tax=unclassified Halomonas TaxID=2609666 RepID=UPI001EF65797|nr:MULTISPECIES: monovalent cation/H+ antiporter complex subunit F [unclassified Halomonas]MCG7600663.1 monovalent cation/H+ antiporter complex subunit F [Halomonas sp. McH1-25]MCP1341241.1 monovalent cation/H+ antiporter complex subunit F [Halomonas sp. FL8]MCP1362931.1 monovalent cation/H+ antiporter complex subunit F [Halomonas sp. BBD45]MCP1364446.1 monovalent cation/H+ antiporter complex subunit F [Halomonas sp. BBD48]